jgi:two-component system, chemotaxis family, chemotaxis protein CheY
MTDMHKIMIVDDSAFMQNRLVKALSVGGYKTITASDGYDAVRLYRENAPDVVLMDVTMPGSDGLDALAEICQMDSGARVIMLTALNQEIIVRQAMSIGARSFLTKPVSPDRLLETLERVLD